MKQPHGSPSSKHSFSITWFKNQIHVWAFYHRVIHVHVHALYSQKYWWGIKFGKKAVLEKTAKLEQTAKL